MKRNYSEKSRRTKKNDSRRRKHRREDMQDQHHTSSTSSLFKFSHMSYRGKSLTTRYRSHGNLPNFNEERIRRTHRPKNPDKSYVSFSGLNSISKSKKRKIKSKFNKKSKLKKTLKVYYGAKNRF